MKRLTFMIIAFMSIAIQGSAQGIIDEGDYAQALINIINNSQLDNQLKIVFKGGVMIAQGSTHLWKKMEPTTIDPVSPPMP